ncbi:MAG: NAD-dependent epimerase/dehydratase family protein [Verrucomicrobiales bacterium]|nr:NAD-dependent epimerase/dehydratase family protein [Verrucomicrobiales bacterium]
MKLLFIGGTGNLSADCARLLHQRGHEIHVVTRGNSPLPDEFHPVVADRKDADALRGALKDLQPEVVLNFLGFDLADVQLDFSLFRDSVQQYLFISSATVYAKPHRRLPLTETAPLGNAFWDYAQKKLACEEWLLERQHEDGFPVTIVRPSHTYSHRWVPNPVSSSSFTFARRLEQGRPVFLPDAGDSLWTLTATGDFAVGLAGLAGNPKAIGETFHITRDEALTWNQIVSEIADALGAKSPQVCRIPTDFICRMAPEMAGPLKGDKANPAVFDNAKIKRFVPDFSATKPFRFGVRESIEWLRAHPEQQHLNPRIDDLCDRVVSAWQSETGSL